MRWWKVASVLVIALMLVGSLIPNVIAEEEEKESKTLTITIDRRVMPESIFHAGRFFIAEDDVRATATLSDYVIRDYAGYPIDGFTIQTASGQTKIPIDDVKRIKFSRCVARETEDIARVERVTEADIFLVNGNKKHVLMNADFGTIEGKTNRGDFFLGKPETVLELVFDDR